jgi:hypothetical protein
MYRHVLVIFVVVRKNQDISAPKVTNIKVLSFWSRGIIIISCFNGRIHVRADPEITDIEARSSIGDVRELLSSKCI